MNKKVVLNHCNHYRLCKSEIGFEIGSLLTASRHLHCLVTCDLSFLESAKPSAYLHINNVQVDIEEFLTDSPFYNTQSYNLSLEQYLSQIKKNEGSRLLCLDIRTEMAKKAIGLSPGKLTKLMTSIVDNAIVLLSINDTVHYELLNECFPYQVKLLDTFNGDGCVMIANYKDFAQQLSRAPGKTKDERSAFKKKVARWAKNLSELRDVEQQAMLSALLERFEKKRK